MHRKPLLKQLGTYEKDFPSEREKVKRYRSFVERRKDCFERSCMEGHVTASAWALDSDLRKVLLLHHGKLGIWVQPGGHCDGETDTLSVAVKEMDEETGVKNFELLLPGLFDIDIHLIPSHKGVPEHFHYDLRYLFRCGENQIKKNFESRDLRWVDLDKVISFNPEEAMHRLVEKTLNFVKTLP